MKKLLFILLTLALNLNVFSQIAMQPHDMPTYNWKEFKEVDSNSENYFGSPYIFKEFINGEVYFKGKDEPIQYKLNYNAYQDIIEFISKQKKYAVTNSEDIERIVIDGSIMLYLPYDNKKGYFFEVIKDDVSLYKKELIKFIAPRDSRNIYDEDEPGRFLEDDPEFYISINNNPLEHIKNKKSLLKLFDSNTELRNYLKSNSINFKEKNDLIKLINFINTSKIKP